MPKRINIEEAIKLHAEGKSWREIGRILGVHPYSVSYKLRKLGYETNKKVGGIKRIDNEEVYRLRDQGYTQNAISQIIGFSESAVQKILRNRREKERKNES